MSEDDSDRKAILSRRAFLVEAALVNAGLVTACRQEPEPRPCLNIAAPPRKPAPDAAPPRRAADVMLPPQPEPTVCLSPPRPRPDAGPSPAPKPKKKERPQICLSDDPIEGEFVRPNKGKGS